MFNTINVEQFRIKNGELASSKKDGNNGAFKIPYHKLDFFCIISDQLGWEHVSISSRRIPKWTEMTHFKNLFWQEDDAVIQIHPPKADYVNYANNCLHLWRPVGYKLILPPSYFVGPK